MTLHVFENDEHFPLLKISSKNFRLIKCLPKDGTDLKITKVNIKYQGAKRRGSVSPPPYIQFPMMNMIPLVINTIEMGSL